MMPLPRRATSLKDRAVGVAVLVEASGVAGEAVLVVSRMAMVGAAVEVTMGTTAVGIGAAQAAKVRANAISRSAFLYTSLIYTTRRMAQSGSLLKR